MADTSTPAREGLPTDLFHVMRREVQKMRSIAASMRKFNAGLDPHATKLEAHTDTILTALQALASQPTPGGGEVDYTAIANKAQAVTGRSIFPSTVKAILEAAALASLPSAEEMEAFEGAVEFLAGQPAQVGGDYWLNLYEGDGAENYAYRTESEAIASGCPEEPGDRIAVHVREVSALPHPQPERVCPNTLALCDCGKFDPCAAITPPPPSDAAQGEYSYERIKHPREREHFRVRDAADNRIATCWDEGNAQFIVSRLNTPPSQPVRVRVDEAKHHGFGRMPMVLNSIEYLFDSRDAQVWNWCRAAHKGEENG